MNQTSNLANLGDELAVEIDIELGKAARHGNEFASLHEAYAVMLEELDEIWDHTRRKRRDRKRDEIRKELIQIAAMAIKGVHSLDNFVGGSV